METTKCPSHKCKGECSSEERPLFAENSTEWCFPIILNQKKHNMGNNSRKTEYTVINECVKEVRTNVHDEECSGRLSVITDDLIQAVKTKIHEKRRFTITTISLEFPDVSRSMVYKIVTEDLWTLCSWRVPRLLTAEHKKKRFAISLNILICYEEEGDSIMSRIITGDEKWVSNITAQNQSNIR
ncbi:histone-lysine N-methyltransferase SETMAR [Trichonephila clavipes]|nr:histone-lysine N-methyltransferase SETMAR [Trichonephila clavipes]